MKIREKLIHALGGFTKEEYEPMRAAAQMPMPICKIERPIKELKARVVIRKSEPALDIDWIKRRLAEQIANRAIDGGLVLVQARQQESDYQLDQVEYTARLMIAGEWREQYETN